MFLIAGAWAFVMPTGAQPDDTAHMARAWAIWDGQIVADPVPDGPDVQLVPEAIVRAGDVACFALDPRTDASCTPSVGESQRLVGISTRAALDDPAFYVVTGWPFHLFAEPANALYASRLIAAFVCALVTALGICAALLHRSSVITASATVVVLTPVVLSSFGSLDPIAWEVAGAVSGVTGLFLLVMEPRAAAARSWAMIAGIGLSVMVIAGASSLLWLAIILGAAVLIGSGRLRQIVGVPAARWSALVVALATGWAIAWERIGGGTVGGRTEGRGYREGLRVLFGESGAWWDAMIGRLGAAVEPSTLSRWAMIMCVGVIIIGGLAAGRLRHVLVLLLMMLASVLAPLAVAVYLYPSLGTAWQGRYNIAIALPCVLFAAMLWDFDSSAPVALRRRLQALLLIAWAVAGVSMIYDALRRFAVGIVSESTQTTYRFFLRSNPWEPPGRVLTWLIVGAIGYLALGLSVVLFSRAAAGRPPSATPSAGHPDEPDGLRHRGIAAEPS